MTNGIYINIDNIKLNSAKAPPVQSPVAIAPPNIGGVTQGILGKITGATNPKSIAKYDTALHITGASTNGIINIGFKTIGSPNINGSPMLNIAGGPPNTIISLRLLPAINKATINPNTIPEPPKYTNASKNAPASTWYPSVAPA